MSGAEPVFVDTNVFMYLAGDDPRMRERCRAALCALVDLDVPLVTSAEVLQEILHRYVSIDRMDRARLVYGAAVDICREVLPVAERQTALALELLSQHPRFPARDALHVAVMQDRGICRILSADRHFDRLDAVQRVDPADVDRLEAGRAG